MSKISFSLRKRFKIKMFFSGGCRGYRVKNSEKRLAAG